MASQDPERNTSSALQKDEDCKCEFIRARCPPVVADSLFDSIDHRNNFRSREPSDGIVVSCVALFLHRNKYVGELCDFRWKS